MGRPVGRDRRRVVAEALVVREGYGHTWVVPEAETAAEATLRFLPSGDAEREEQLLQRLVTDVKELELGEVRFERAASEADEKSGLTPVEWVSVACSAGPVLVQLLQLAADWARRAKHPVEVRIGDDRLILGDATDAQQDKVIEAFLARHSTD